MISLNLFALATASLLSLSSAAPAPAPAADFAPKNETLSIQSAPTWISGPWQNFPAINTWQTFDQMFDANKNSMKSTGSTWDDIGRINVAIRDASKNIGVDERVILGIIMQESHGYVGVRTTFSPGDNIPTAGIMQCSSCPGYPGRTGLSQVSDNSHGLPTCLLSRYASFANGSPPPTSRRTKSPAWSTVAPSTTRPT